MLILAPSSPGSLLAASMAGLPTVAHELDIAALLGQLQALVASGLLEAQQGAAVDPGPESRPDRKVAGASV